MPGEHLKKNFYTGFILLVLHYQDILYIITAIVALVSNGAHGSIVIAGVAPLTTWYCDIFGSGKS